MAPLLMPPEGGSRNLVDLQVKGAEPLVAVSKYKWAKAGAAGGGGRKVVQETLDSE